MATYADQKGASRVQQMPRSGHPGACEYSASVCEDAWQLGSTFQGGDYRYEQLESGALLARTVDAGLGPLQITYEDINRCVRYRGRSLQKIRALVLRLREGPNHYVNGRVARPASICLEPMEVPSAAWCRGGLEAIGIMIDDQALQEYVSAAWPGRELPPGSSQTKILEVPDLARRLFEQSATVIEFAKTSRDQQGPLAQRALMEATFELLVECLMFGDDDECWRSGAYFPALNVERAHEFAVSHMDCALTVLDLCRALRICRRALQRSFQEVIGINPARYLLQLRLNRVHRELIERGEEVCVQDVAVRWGFWHLSRFAQFYRRSFGVLPSQTQRAPTGRPGIRPLLDFSIG